MRVPVRGQICHLTRLEARMWAEACCCSIPALRRQVQSVATSSAAYGFVAELWGGELACVCVCRSTAAGLLSEEVEEGFDSDDHPDVVTEERQPSHLPLRVATSGIGALGWSELRLIRVSVSHVQLVGCREDVWQGVLGQGADLSFLGLFCDNVCACVFRGEK